jgi:hypothetical protein
MAPNPNRRPSPLSLERATALNLQIAKPFPPLTSQVAQQAKRDPSTKKISAVTIIHAAHTCDSSHTSNKYWDWPTVDEAEKEKQDIIDSIVEEEKARKLLSIEHVEDNLQTNDNSKSQLIYAEPTDNDYWCDGNEDRATANKPTNMQSYWDWPTLTSQEENRKVIDSILEEDYVRQLLIVTHIAVNIIRQSADVSAPKEKRSPSLQSDEYWDWSLPVETGYWQWPNSPKDKKSFRIQQILEEEISRTQFSIQHLESNLLREAATLKPSVIKATATTETSDSYWDY